MSYRERGWSNLSNNSTDSFIDPRVEFYEGSSGGYYPANYGCCSRCRFSLINLSYSTWFIVLHFIFLFTMTGLLSFLVVASFLHTTKDASEELWFVVVEMGVDAVIIMELGIRVFIARPRRFFRCRDSSGSCNWFNYFDLFVGFVALGSLSLEASTLFFHFMPTSNVTASTFANVARLLRDGTRIFRLFLFVRWFTFSLIDLQSQNANESYSGGSFDGRSPMRSGSHRGSFRSSPKFIPGRASSGASPIGTPNWSPTIQPQQTPHSLPSLGQFDPEASKASGAIHVSASNFEERSLLKGNALEHVACGRGHDQASSTPSRSVFGQ